MVVYNVPESNNECTETVFKDFLENKLGVANEVANGQRVHRLGPRRIQRDGDNNRNKVRPIIAGLRDYPDVDICMAKAKNLKGKGLGISRDYPEEIRKARQRLESKRKEAVSAKKKASIIFPAIFIVDGAVIADEFPDWREVMRG